jgi:hypothetical protein
VRAVHPKSSADAAHVKVAGKDTDLVFEMDVEQAGGRPRLRWPFLVALALALAGLVVRYTVLTSGGAASVVVRVRIPDGVTGQGTKIQLGIDNNRVSWLQTSLNARCEGGSTWHETWSPAEGHPVHFTMSGRSFATAERASPRFAGGIVGRVAFTIRGTLTSPGAAQGTIRLVARFYRGEQQWNACDSLDVQWAVGPRAAARLHAVPVGSQTGVYYPAVPSLAVNVSPARQRFIERVDRTCVDTYRRITRSEDAAAAPYRYASLSTLGEWAAYVGLHAWQLRTLMRLGQPPEARALYDAWLANFRQRVLVEWDAGLLYQDNRLAAAKRAIDSLRPLKARGNLLGQRFGLVRCTSNGDRTPVPILNDGQPLPLP